MSGDARSGRVYEPYDRGERFKAGFLRTHSAFLVRLSSLVDALVIFSSQFCVLWFLDRQWETHHLVTSLLAALIFEMIATTFDLYRSWRVIRLRYEIIRIFFYWMSAIMLLTFLLFILEKQELINNFIILSWFFLAFLVMCVVHCSVRMVTRYVRAFGYDVRRVAFIGATEITLRMVRIFKDHPWMGMKSVGMYDDRHNTKNGEDRIFLEEYQLGGCTDDLVKLARLNQIDIIYICLPLSAEKRIKAYIDLFSDTTVSIYYCPSFFNFDLIHSRWDEVFGQPVISIVESPFVDHQRYLKRLEVLVIVVALSPVLVPLMVVIGLLIKLTSSGPVFFKQNRSGMNGKDFIMWKFRTMYVEKCKESFLQVTKNAPRITPLGAFLRKTSLDEIPQFINVLIGDMSVVGPRPHPVILNDDLRKRIHRYMLRHKIKPGITGLAQVNGLRGETESLDKMTRRIEHDLQYMRHWSLMLDIKILFKTIFSMSGNNVY